MWEKYITYPEIVEVLTKNNTNTSTATTTTFSPMTTASANVNQKLKLDRMSNISYTLNRVVHQTTSLKMTQCGESAFTILSATLADSGIFTCIIFNHKGYIKRSTNLTVLPGDIYYYINLKGLVSHVN